MKKETSSIFKKLLIYTVKVTNNVLPDAGRSYQAPTPSTVSSPRKHQRCRAFLPTLRVLSRSPFSKTCPSLYLLIPTIKVCYLLY